MPNSKNKVRLECSQCKRINYDTFKNQQKLRNHRLLLKKLCDFCGTRTEHRETK